MKTIRQIIAILVGGIKTEKAYLAGILVSMLAPGSFAQSNKCLSFNGSISKVTFSNNDLQLNNNDHIAVCAWVNWGCKTNCGHNAVIISVSDSTGNGDGQFWLQHDSTNSFFQFVLKTDSGKKMVVNSKSNPLVGNWYFVMGVFKSNRIELYVDGILEGVDSISSGGYINPYKNSFAVKMGNNVLNTKGFNGQIDEVALWNNMSFDSSMIQSMMLIKNSYQSAAWSYWSMDTIVGGNIMDAGINAANGTLINASVVNWGTPSGQMSFYVPRDSATNTFRYISSFHNDSLIIDSVNFSAKGIYVYEIDAAPSDSSMPSGVNASGTRYYYGIFIPDYQGGAYRVNYYINPAGTKRTNNSGSDPSVLLIQNSQSPTNWINTGITDIGSSPKFSITNQTQWAQYTWGTLNGASIELKNNISITNAYPNPFNSSLHINVTSSKNEAVKVFLININGAIITEKEHTCMPGNNNISIDGLSDVPAGLYFAKVVDSKGNNHILKVVKN